jgi:hypothetical protein
MSWIHESIVKVPRARHITRIGSTLGLSLRAQGSELTAGLYGPRQSVRDAPF